MSLDSLVNAASGDDLKFVFVGGKGGVGKTTSSSAIATLLATICEKRVLLVSTDPAHSLGDAWRTSFSNVPKGVGLEGGGSLDVMEVDPQESMQGELKLWADVSEQLFPSNGKENEQSDEWKSKIDQFQEWLSGIPGIDEATALSNAITHIESGKYDLIVFDTAPTGHTIKLLALPAILEQGIDKLQSWQTTFWGYMQALKSGGSFSKQSQLKDQVRDKLTRYKTNIQKVAKMLQDQARTRFVVVCIAEFLSVSESQRLLQELAQHKVVASHIIVNQLVVQDALSTDELAELEALAEVGHLQLPQELLQKTVHACRLTTARKSIQQRYLAELKGYPETQSLIEGICEVPLLAEEVTGTEAIRRFAQLLIKDPQVSVVGSRNTGGKLYDEAIAAENQTFSPGDVVKVIGLGSSPHFNNLEGKVTSFKEDDTGRYAVTIQYEGKTKKLGLKPQNMELLRTGNSKKSKTDPTAEPQGPSIMDKAKAVLDDPEIKKLVEDNPKLKDAVQDCLGNPMNAMKYLGDPELSPFLTKIIAKL